MRCVLTLALTILAAAPAAAWEFSPGPVCTLSHEAPGARVAVTYDPRQAQPYAIAITLPDPWPDGPLFGIRYDGGRMLEITTDRHVLSDGGRTLTVTDRGFGNVLDGLQFNAQATAVTGDRAVSLSLDGAADPVEAFRACATAPVA
jgi:hypothetical protein